MLDNERSKKIRRKRTEEIKGKWQSSVYKLTTSFSGFFFILNVSLFDSQHFVLFLTLFLFRWCTMSDSHFLFHFLFNFFLFSFRFFPQWIVVACHRNHRRQVKSLAIYIFLSYFGVESSRTFVVQNNRFSTHRTEMLFPLFLISTVWCQKSINIYHTINFSPFQHPLILVSASLFLAALHFVSIYWFCFLYECETKTFL